MANGKQKSKKKIIIFSSIGLLILVLIVIAFVGGNKEDIISVQTEKVMKRNITQTVSATGKINPEFKVVITPEVSGEIVSLPVKEGEVVKKGDLLLKIRQDAYIAQVQQSEANLTSAKATMAQRKADLDRVSADYNRVKELHAKGLSSDAELETAKSSYLSAKAQYEGAEANVAQNEAALKVQKDNLRKTTIYSPMDGIITQLNMELGERVLGSNFTQGTDIMTVSDLNNIEAVVDVDENDVVLISVGDTARVKVDAFGDKEFRGTVKQIGNSAQATGAGTQDQVVNFEVKIKLIDTDPNLRPGMSCNAKIETERIKDVLSVPIQSVTARSPGDFMDKGSKNSSDDGAEPTKKKIDTKPKEVVFVVSGGKAKMVEVSTGISDDNFIQVKTGLTGDEVVITGSYRAISRELKEGSTIRVENRGNAFQSEKK
ncbi:MAG TPA: efflux RND transporter periplasmic adaptor subunit [Ignavibacteriaceae bacterium]|nr:efflux RND transporter periplasmic adaptor subunit [Ignavibacteriaceae bacterium]